MNYRLQIATKIWKINWIIHIFCMFLLIALNLFSRTAVFALEAIDFLCFWSLADILNFPLVLRPHFLATTVTKAFIKSQLISEFQSRKFRLETLFWQFPMPMAKPVRTDTKIGTHIGSIICWLSWLWISSSVANIFINRRWFSESLFKVLQIRFLFGWSKLDPKITQYMAIISVVNSVRFLSSQIELFLFVPKFSFTSLILVKSTALVLDRK